MDCPVKVEVIGTSAFLLQGVRPWLDLKAARGNPALCLDMFALFMIIRELIDIGAVSRRYDTYLRERLCRTTSSSLQVAPNPVWSIYYMSVCDLP